MGDLLTTNDWEILLGEQIRGLRLARNIDQIEMAARAGIALNAVKRLECGKGSTLTSMINVLRVLDKVKWLETLNPEPNTPWVTWRHQAVPRRRRVSKVRNSTPENEESTAKSFPSV
jgi:transcriptional regulator with XRE-family HTH domain